MNYGFTSASSLQKGTSAYEYALMRNEAIRHDQRSFSGTESLSTYIYDDYDLWKFRNNRDYTPVELDARGDLTAAQKELLKNQLFIMPAAIFTRKCSIGWLRRCRST